MMVSSLLDAVCYVIHWFLIVLILFQRVFERFVGSLGQHLRQFRLSFLFILVALRDEHPKVSLNPTGVSTDESEGDHGSV